MQAIAKAIVAVLMSVLTMITVLTGKDFGLPPGFDTTIIAFITPILVWLIPNKQTE